MAICDAERLDAPLKELATVREAQNTARAFNDPKQLWVDEQRVRSAIFGGVSTDRVQQIIDEVNKYQAKRVIRGD